MKIIIAILAVSVSGCFRVVKDSSIDPTYRRPQVVKVACLPIYNSVVNGYFDITFSFAPEFIRAGWRVVDRSAVDAILAEQKFQLSGAVENRAVEVGRVTGANLVASGIYGDNQVYGGYLNIRLIDVETGEVVATALCEGNSHLGACTAKELIRLVKYEK